MKTHVIQLEPHDDFISIRDKMSWAKAPRILLVWAPSRRRARISEIDLKLLRRHAVSLGANLSLVTRQNNLRRMAEHAGLPVFRTTTEAQRADWPTMQPPPEPTSRRPKGRELRAARVALRHRSPTWLSHPAARLGFFSLGVLSVILLVVLFIPSAEIRLQPATQTQTLTLPVSASPAATTVALSGLIPAYSKTVSVSASDSLPASGQLLLPETYAHGTLTLTNLTDQVVSVPSGSVLIANPETPLRLATLAAVEVPAGAGKTAEVDARLLQAGALGNLAAQTSLAFEGPLGLNLTASNSEAFTGGTDRQQPAPTDDDRSRLFARLSAALQQQAEQEIQDPAQIIFPASLAPSQVTKEQYSPQAGAAGAKLTLDLAQDFQVDYASQADLEALARAALDASLPAGFEPGTGDIRITPLSEPLLGSDGLTRWRVRVEREVRAAIKAQDVVQQVRGRSVAGARALLGTLLLSAAPEIKVWPDWFPVLPLIPLRITVGTGT